jgi:hypothetical protein
MVGALFDYLEPAQLGGSLWFIIVRVVGQELLLDAFYNTASKVGCSGCVSEVLCKLSDELVTPSCRTCNEARRIGSLVRSALSVMTKSLSGFVYQLD